MAAKGVNVPFGIAAKSVDEAVANACVNAATYHEAKLIITLTSTGTSARLISKYRPRCPIMVVARDEHIGAGEVETLKLVQAQAR